MPRDTLSESMPSVVADNVVIGVVFVSNELRVIGP